MDLKLLLTGAYTGKWHEASRAARLEYKKGGIVTRLITPRALQEILQPPSVEDQRLCKWMVNRETGVFVALAGWIHSGVWKRGLDVAVRSDSWKYLRELLQVGAKGSLSDTPWSFNVWYHKTCTAVSNLMHAPMEQADGSRRKMPRVVVTFTPGCDDVEEVLSYDMSDGNGEP